MCAIFTAIEVLVLKIWFLRTRIRNVFDRFFILLTAAFCFKNSLSLIYKTKVLTKVESYRRRSGFKKWIMEKRPRKDVTYNFTEKRSNEQGVVVKGHFYTSQFGKLLPIIENHPYSEVYERNGTLYCRCCIKTCTSRLSVTKLNPSSN